jgi:hypothetical protein
MRSWCGGGYTNSDQLVVGWHLASVFGGLALALALAERSAVSLR